MADSRDDEPASSTESGPRLGFRTRLTLALIAASVIPLAVFGVFVTTIEGAIGGAASDPRLASILLFAATVVIVLAVFASFAVADQLTRPLRSISAAVDRVSAGDLRTPIHVAGDDELARLAESHNRLAADLGRRNRELGRILAAIDEVSPRDNVAALVDRDRKSVV